MNKIQTQLSTPKLLWSLLTRSRKSLVEFEPLTIRFENIQTQLKRYKTFEQMFGNPNDICSFMFIQSFPFMGQMLAQSNMPSALFGIIHLGAEFIRHAPHCWHSSYDIEVSIDGFQAHRQGTNYQLSTRFYQNNELTLENRNTILSRDVSLKPKRKAENVSRDVDGELLTAHQIELATAWRYASLSADFNPIHLHSLLAKALGLKTALIHGMYNVHWTFAQLPQDQRGTWQQISVAFNRPCFMPALTKLYQMDSDNYALYSDDLKDRFLTFQIQ